MGTVRDIVRWVRRTLVLGAGAVVLHHLTFIVGFTVLDSDAAPQFMARGVSVVVFVAGLVAVSLTRARVAVILEIAVAACSTVYAIGLLWDPASSASRELVVAPVPEAARPAQTTIARGFKKGESARWPEIFDPGSKLLASWETDDLETQSRVLLAHVDEIDRAWGRSAVCRAWIDDVNQFTVISDFSNRPGDDFLNLAKVHHTARIIGHRAGLLALSGHGDEAIETLIPLAAFSGRLRRGSRSLLSVMIATSLEKRVVERARFVLATSQPTNAARHRLADVLDDGMRGGDDLARAVSLDAFTTAASLLRAVDEPEAALDPEIVNSVSGQLGLLTARVGARFSFNRNRFLRDVHEYVDVASTAALTGDHEVWRRWNESFDARVDGLHWKNRTGEIMLILVVSAVPVKSFHETLANRWSLVRDLREQRSP